LGSADASSIQVNFPGMVWFWVMVRRPFEP
jgi:hypothetical protein